MDKQSVELLDFFNIREEVAGYARSCEGAALVRSQDFVYTEEDLGIRADLASDWKVLLSSDCGRPDFSFPEVGFISRLKKQGTVLEGFQLADSAAFIESSLKMKSYCSRGADELPQLTGRLAETASGIIELGGVSEGILAELNPDGSVKENHPLLKAARARVASIFRQIQKASGAHLNADRDIWQSATPAIRDGRTVLALKTNYRGRVKGFVHEVSSSGATVFIEPFDLVELNNSMTVEQSRLEQQIFKIYKALTGKLREHADELSALIEQVALLDSFYARAVYSIRHNCTRAEISGEGLAVIEGRHPGLGQKAVPITLHFEKGLRVLIITGPNAGGKTVSLKTCGLFVLMNQFGMDVPAAEGTRLRLYDEIYADIGDDQSIEQSLSTFSGHMSRINTILRKAGSGALVLLDELGSGTDPSEGSAIAMGVLDYLRERGVSVIVTTHHSAVKNFGYTHEGAANASVSFDTDMMRPTYRIIEGIPGDSHAIEIAASCGIPDEVIMKTKAYSGQSNTTISGMIEELEKRQRMLAGKELELEQKGSELKEARRRADLLSLKLKQQELIQKKSEFGELRRFVEDSRRMLENLVAELRTGEITREKTLKVKETISQLNTRVDGFRDEIEKSEEAVAAAQGAGAADADCTAKIPALAPGSSVKHRRTGRIGIVSEKRKKDEWLVAFGNLKLNVREADLAVIAEDRKPEIKITTERFDIKPSFEIDLRGMRVAEAEKALEKQLDAALMSGLSEFGVIHGLGDGILQKAVHDFLAGSASVSGFDFSSPEEGGFGRTIVRLG